MQEWVGHDRCLLERQDLLNPTNKSGKMSEEGQQTAVKAGLRACLVSYKGPTVMWRWFSTPMLEAYVPIFLTSSLYRDSISSRMVSVHRRWNITLVTRTDWIQKASDCAGSSQGQGRQVGSRYLWILKRGKNQNNISAIKLLFSQWLEILYLVLTTTPTN